MNRTEKGSSRARWGLLAGAIATGALLLSIIPAWRRKAMRVTTILKKDHRMGTGLLKALEITPKINRKLRTSLRDQVCRTLMAHERAEDEVLYSAIRDRGYTIAGPDVEEAYHEQDRVKESLERMANTDPMSDRFDSQLQEVMGMVERHANREEESVFPFVERRMSREEQQRLGQQLQAVKKDVKRQTLAA